MDNITRHGTEKGQGVEVLPGGKLIWKRPSLAYIGKLGDLVKGHGKSGGNDDSDPFGTQKPGVG